MMAKVVGLGRQKRIIMGGQRKYLTNGIILRQAFEQHCGSKKALDLI